MLPAIFSLETVSISCHLAGQTLRFPLRDWIVGISTVMSSPSKHGRAPSYTMLHPIVGKYPHSGLFHYFVLLPSLLVDTPVLSICFEGYKHQPTHPEISKSTMSTMSACLPSALRFTAALALHPRGVPEDPTVALNLACSSPRSSC